MAFPRITCNVGGDWWAARDCNPQCIIDSMIENEISDTEKWMKRLHPEQKLTTYELHREEARLSKGINMALRRHWIRRTYWEQLESRQEQITQAVRGAECRSNREGDS
jgi:hypothetical protein